MVEYYSNGKTPKIQTGRLPKKIKAMLDSGDYELVQLGANLMREYVPREEWGRVMDMFSFEDSYNENLYVRKWLWSIIEDSIFIQLIPKSK